MLAVPAVQFFLFAFYARVLGAEQYGIYIAMMAWAPICLEFVALGAGEVLIKRVSRASSSFPEAAAHFYRTTALTLPFALTLYTGATMLLVRHTIGWQIVLGVGACELIGMRLFTGAENFAIATRRIRWANEFRILQAFPRALGVGVAYYLLDLHSVSSLALAGSVGILLGALVCIAVAWHRFPRPSGGFDSTAFGEGIWFAGNQIARAGQQNIDRVVLGWSVEPSLLAIFGAAQRFVQVGILPIQAILRSTYPNFFARGHEGVRSSLRYGGKVLLLISAVGAMCAAVLWIAAMFVPAALGNQFNASAGYLRWLTPSLLLVGFNYVAADILTGSDHQRLRTSLMMISIAIQAGMFALFHEGSELLLAAYAGIGFAAASNWTAVLYLAWRERRDSPVGLAAA